MFFSFFFLEQTLFSFVINEIEICLFQTDKIAHVSYKLEKSNRKNSYNLKLLCREGRVTEKLVQLRVHSQEQHLFVHVFVNYNQN